MHTPQVQKGQGFLSSIFNEEISSYIIRYVKFLKRYKDEWVIGPKDLHVT